MDHYVSAFETFAAERQGDAVHDLRQRGMDQFRKLGFPDTRLEEWRFTNVSPLAGSAFALGRPSSNGIAPEDAARLGFGSGLVFVDGQFRADLSQIPAGVQVGPLRSFWSHDAVRQQLGRHATGEDQAFVALNTAFLEDGVFVALEAGRRLDEPLHVLYVGTDKVCHPRNLFVLERNAEASIIETYVSAGDAPHWTNAVCEVVLGANAVLNHTRLQLENEEAFHVSDVHAHLERDSRYTSNAMTLGGRLVRNDITAALDGEGSLATLNGVVSSRGSQHVDNFTRLEHRKPHCESHELYKAILADKSSGVFTGYIHVFPDAQKTDAYQSSASLLLSDDAVMDSKPQLEIYADDVKCSHGSTIGQLDADALFYLRSRGVPRGEATNILIRAFAGDVTQRIDEEPVRERVETLLRERLPGGAIG